MFKFVRCLVFVELWAVRCWLAEVIRGKKSCLYERGVTQLLQSCLTLVGHLLYQCCENQARFIQLQGMHAHVCITYISVARHYTVSGQKLVAWKQHTKYIAAVNNQKNIILYTEMNKCYLKWSSHCGKSFPSYYWMPSQWNGCIHTSNLYTLAAPPNLADCIH